MKALVRRLLQRIIRSGQHAPAPAPAPAPEPAPIPIPEPMPVPAPAPTALRPALVIPVHNDAEGLARLLGQVEALDCFNEVIVVDDGSTPPVTLPSAPHLTLLRHETAKGGGVARNLGLKSVTATHVLFFDADDLLTDDLPALLTALGGAGDFDFCQFKYADSRVHAEMLWGHPDWDEQFWQRSGLSVGHLQEAPADVWPILAQTANYPWNKVYRTAFLRDHDIGCAATQVHQDIPLHWLGFLAATRILTSDRICAWHHVSAAGGRLTNRSGPERLEVFEALTPVMTAASPTSPDWQTALSAFVLGLIDWCEARIAPELRPELRSREAAFLRDTVGPWLTAIEHQDPEVAHRIRARMDTAP